MKPERDYADLVVLGAVKMTADEEMSPDQRFSLAEAVRGATGLTTARGENAASDRMLHTALLRAEGAVADEVGEEVLLAMHTAWAPCHVRIAVCGAVGTDDDEKDAIIPAAIDMDEWRSALLDLAEEKAGRDWELEPTLLEMTWCDRLETERRLGIPEGYFEAPNPGTKEVAAASGFLDSLEIPQRFRNQ